MRSQSIVIHFLSPLIAYLMATGIVLADEKPADEKPADDSPVAGNSAELSAAGNDFFEKKVRPILVEHCYECHSQSSKPIQGKLLLDSKTGWQRGGESGVTIVPGESNGGTFVAAINYETFEMPPTGKLSETQIETLTQWVTMGAPDPRTADATETATKEEIDWSAVTDHWAFRPPHYSEVPSQGQSRRANGVIDAYIQSSAAKRSLAANPQASREVLMRRLSYDLLGLPPSTEDVQRFVDDEHPLAYQRLVDRLLADPAYGERWARPWLDIVRYAEDQAHIVGNNKALFYPNAFRYRDWLIGALNKDLSLDNFIRFQLAADQVEDGEADLEALGFMGLGPKYYRRNDVEVMADEWEDRVDVVSRGFLGLTVACARCHDHKYDPIETEDYYSLAGVFASTEMFNRPFDDSIEKNKDGHAKDPSNSLHVVRDASNVRDLQVMIRGDVKNLGEEVPRGFLRLVSPDGRRRFEQGSGRRELAENIASIDNPLTSRVWVNRTWREFFGEGIVRTTSNFGVLGERPTHPELLDFLALELQRHDWSPKRLHRMLVVSATYQQSSELGPTSTDDPENRWLSRMPRRRLTVESWRDSVLNSVGMLNREIGGPSIKASDPQASRRTVYSEISRFELDRLLALFDFPDPNNHSSGRVETTTPLQKLFLLNSEFMVRCSDQLAVRVINHSADDQQCIRFAFSQCFSRQPTIDESAHLLEFIASVGDRKAAWQQISHALLASNESMYLD